MPYFAGVLLPYFGPSSPRNRAGFTVQQVYTVPYDIPEAASSSNTGIIVGAAIGGVCVLLGARWRSGRKARQPDHSSGQ